MFRLLRRLRWILALLAIGLGGVHQLRQHEALFPRAEPYERGLYKHWTDADGDCQNTRTEALIRDSLEPVTLSADGCSVVYGRWQDPFTGAILIDPGMLDIDH
ncbi:MAG: HNH endonuclease, partial [Rhodospirillaceae bacterium]